MSIVLPRPLGFSDPAVQAWAERFADSVQNALDDLERPARVGIVVAPPTPPATFDPTTAGLVLTAQTLATLLTALKQVGRIT